MTIDNPSTNKSIIDKQVIDHLAKNRQNRATLQILITEDDLFSRKLIVKSIKGYEILQAENGESTLQQYALNVPDIVFLDFELPDMNGLEILQQIQQADADAFVVMLTSHTESSIVKQAIEYGAKGYIAKPFKKEKINAYIDKYTSEYKRQG